MDNSNGRSSSIGKAQEDPPFIGNVRTVETSRLILRGAVPEDVDDLFECFKDEEVMRYWDSLPHASSDPTKLWVQKMVQGPRNGITDFVICLRSDRGSTSQEDASRESFAKVIGKAGIWHDNEIGFLLNRRHWGQGLALEALIEVLDIAFVLDGKDLQVPGGAVPEDVIADVDPRNHASLGVLKKLGFAVYATKEKTFQVGDQWVDSVYLSLPRQAWVTNRQEIKRYAERKSRPASG